MHPITYMVKLWRETLTDKEKDLHDLASVKLKKTLNAHMEDGDQGSYFPERCHAFRAWLKTRQNAT